MVDLLRRGGRLIRTLKGQGILENVRPIRDFALLNYARRALERVRETEQERE